MKLLIRSRVFQNSCGNVLLMSQNKIPDKKVPHTQIARTSIKNSKRIRGFCQISESGIGKYAWYWNWAKFWYRYITINYVLTELDSALLDVVSCGKVAGKLAFLLHQKS